MGNEVKTKIKRILSLVENLPYLKKEFYFDKNKKDNRAYFLKL